MNVLLHVIFDGEVIKDSRKNNVSIIPHVLALYNKRVENIICACASVKGLLMNVYI